MIHRHHRKRRSQGGDDSYGNLIELPPEVHELVHRYPSIAYENGLLVRSHDDPAAIRPNVNGFLSMVAPDLIEQPKPKRRNYEKDSQERRQRKRISVAVPADTEDGGAIWDETLRDVKAALVGLGLYDNPEKIPNYEAIIAALRDWLNDLVPVYPLPDADRDGWA